MSEKTHEELMVVVSSIGTVLSVLDNVNLLRPEKERYAYQEGKVAGLGEAIQAIAEQAAKLSEDDSKHLIPVLEKILESLNA